MSSPATTPLYLLKGAVYALEQCGLLLRDANILFRGGSYANTVVLAAFAREELGRSNILLVLRKEALGGKDVTTEEIQRRCVQHVIKQQRGMLSITMRPTEKSAEAKLCVRMETHPHSPEWQQADAELEKITQKLKKRTPNDRYQSRISALYVQPISDTEWNRPTETSASFAGTFLNDAVNDYAGRYHQGYIPPTDDPILKHIDPELYGALEQWPERPELTPPVWPDQLQMFCRPCGNGSG